jgi:sugar diacid utilization regulator/GAF domain-containing protein
MPVSSATEALILALLVEDASESELRRALASLRSETAGEDERGRVDQLGRYAIELHQARVEDRRRAVGLTALSDTATDLAAHLEIDELLAAICRRARLLLGTDVAYVTLRDADAGDTYVHATDGIVSEAFRAMRLPTGTGLGGLVAQTGQPESTANYASDGRLHHSQDVDQRVATEGLSGIVAAPLKRGNEIFGVLMSGSREVRQFEPSEVALFASLASHAAVALHNARLIQRSRDTLADLARAHEALQDHAQRVERVRAIHEQLADLALQGVGVGEFLEAVAAHLPGEIELRAASGESLEAQSAVAGDQELENWIEAPVLAGRDELGVLRLRSADREGIAEEVLQRAAGLVASLLLSRQAHSEAQHRYRSMLLEELLGERGAAGTELRRRAVRAGIALDIDQVVLVLAPDASAERWAWLQATRLAEQRQAVVGTVAGRIVVIEAGLDAGATAGAWSELLKAGGGSPATIGAAAGAIGTEGVRASHRDAARALHILLALNRHGSWATVSQLGIFGQMLGRADDGDLRAFLTRTLGPVKAHDAGRGTDLWRTLEGFLAESGHLANTARRLGIHVNTLYQRLERLDEVLGVGWRESDRRLELHLAVRLDALERQLDHGP